MKRKIISSLAVILAGVFVCSGCSKKKTIDLTVWTPPEDIEAVTASIDNFKDHYKEDVNFNITIREETIQSAKTLLLSEDAPNVDVFRFADDQFLDLYHADVLSPLNEYTSDVINRNGGDDSTVVKSAMVDDSLYASPATASSGYFLYYDTRVLDENDIKSMDSILDKCASAQKYMSMDFDSGWYTYSFFGGAGMNITTDEEGLHNVCDFNRTDSEINGIDVAQAMLNISTSKGFKAIKNESVIDEAGRGDMAAVVSGTWHYEALSEIWEGNIGAAKLPTYTVNDQQLQMKSFAGYTYYGVHKNTSSPYWAERLANWITDYDSQLARFNASGDCPSNVMAAETEEIKSSPMISALLEQNQHSITQNVLNPYWDAMSIYGSVIASGNTVNIDLQKLLDQTVSSIEE